MTQSRKRETLIVRRHGYRWALAAAYLAMAIILTVTIVGVPFDGSGISKAIAWRKIK